MPTNRAELLARPDQQTRLALGTGDLDEFDAFFLAHVLNKAGPVTPRLVLKK